MDIYIKQVRLCTPNKWAWQGIRGMHFIRVACKTLSTIISEPVIRRRGSTKTVQVGKTTAGREDIPQGQQAAQRRLLQEEVQMVGMVPLRLGHTLPQAGREGSPRGQPAVHHSLTQVA